MIASVAAFFGFPSPETFLMLVAAALIGGAVRGFTGFGFAMVFVPIATIAVGPSQAAALIWLIDIPFAWPLAAASFRQVDWRGIFPLVAGAALTAPLGVWLLVHADPATARWIVAIVILAATAALATGWRWRGRAGVGLSLGVGGLSGAASGLAQLGGMPLAIFWLSSQQGDPRQTRHNMNGFFALLPLVTGFLYWRQGFLTMEAFWMALPLCLPYGLAMLLGARLFVLAPAHVFRGVAYVVIALAALVALPALDPLFRR